MKEAELMLFNWLFTANGNNNRPTPFLYFIHPNCSHHHPSQHLTFPSKVTNIKVCSLLNCHQLSRRIILLHHSILIADAAIMDKKKNAASESSPSVLLLLSVSFFILLWSSPMAATAALDPQTVEPSKEEARRWMVATKSREKQEESDACNASPYLSYLRSQLQELFELRKEFLSAEPLAYSFYVKNVLQPYRSLLPEANAPSTSFCYLDKNFFDCSKRCPLTWDPLVCLPNSDSSTEGTCVGCRHLNTAIQAGALKDEASIRHLNATCDPIRSRGPKSAPQRKTNEARWLRWLLESSFVFEGQKAGANCSAGPGLSKARYHLDVLMRKQFGARKDDDDLTLTTPGKEGPEEELKYERVREELNRDEQQRKLYEQKFEGIIHESGWFPEVFCSREEGLVCMGGKCVECGDEGVKE
jgi:hypothetical protein